MTELVPHYRDIDEVPMPYTKNRLDRILDCFIQNFDKEPEFFTRSPGRVNLMGDHIDYCDFSVLPMAIAKDVLAAVLVNDSLKIELSNSDSEFSRQTIDMKLDGSVTEIDHGALNWASYFQCAMIVAHKYILEKYPEQLSNGSKPLKGMQIAFDGTVPAGGGLSSSAAFCVTSALAILRANGIQKVPKNDLTKITAVSEHYVGLNNGGMDQCASVCGELGKALLISFKPQLRAEPFQFPILEDDEMVFVITNTLLQSNKNETAPVKYNLRVVEVAVAAEILATSFDLKLPKDSNLGTGTLRGFIDSYSSQIEKKSSWDGTEINAGIERLTTGLDLLEKVYSDGEKDGLTTEEAALKVEMTVEEFKQKYLTKFPVRYQRLQVYKRTRHVFSEALRVLQTLKLIKDYNEDSTKFLQSFGKLMDESQASCKDNFNSSSEELDELCQIARSNGALGSRTTGAGWGGSAVHLTTTKKVKQLFLSLEEQYYSKFSLSPNALAEAIVVSRPAAGSYTFGIAS